MNPKLLLVSSLYFLCLNAFARQTGPAPTAPPAQQSELATFDDAKSAEELSRVKRRNSLATITFIDALDRQPIEGVSVIRSPQHPISDAAGRVTFDQPANPRGYAGLDSFIRLRADKVGTLKKLGKPIDTSKLLLPLFVRLPLANHPIGEPLTVTVPLRFDGVLLKGNVSVDASAADLTDWHRRKLQSSLALFADGVWAGGIADVLVNQEVTVGPVPQTTNHGYVQALNDFIPVDLEDGFALLQEDGSEIIL
jgi:hypothetical protein